MAVRAKRVVVWLAAASWSTGATAFRNCNIENSHAYLASTRYLVGEVEFDPVTGLASGTQTIYNYSNQRDSGFQECHVTYELTGSYSPGSGTFVLDAHRTNFSQDCPRELIALSYPADRTYALQMEFGESGITDVHLADNGEVLARGSWEDGRTVYKTPETCTAF